MSAPDIIIRDVKLDDLTLAVRAARFLVERPERRDALLFYGSGDDEEVVADPNSVKLYAYRAKASIIVRGQS